VNFSILGSVEAVADDHALLLGGPRQRALLARLLIDANRVVSVDRLASDLWEVSPHDAHGALQNQVSRLRKVLGDRLATKPPGYFIRVEPGELDLDRFRSLVAEAGSTPELAARSRLLREADALFRGTPLADVDAPFAASEAAALEELRLAAVEGRVDTDLDRGRHAELVPELGALVREHPLRERLRSQQILALYRCGRQADALDAYREAKRMLDEELGLEPSPALRELERAILTHDASLAATGVAVDDPLPPTMPIVVAPRQPRARWGRVALGVAFVVLVVAASTTAAILATHTSSNAAVPIKLKAHTPIAGAVVTTAHKTNAPRRVHHAKARLTARPVVHRHARSAGVVVTTSRTSTTAIVAKPSGPKKKTATATTRARVNATPKPTSVDAPPVAWTSFSDNFSETAPDLTMWGPYAEGTGAAWALQNGRLELTLPGTGATGGRYNQISVSFGTQCRFNGNFDARVDYQLLTWPSGNGSRMQLSAWIFPAPNSAVARSSTASGEDYDGGIAGAGRAFATSDQQGSLRIARRNGVMTSYAQSGGKWVALASGKAAGQVSIGLQLFAPSNSWAHDDVSAAFDNFALKAQNPSCP
jgi:DNA-binding SARP family transcriptional activator